MKVKRDSDSPKRQRENNASAKAIVPITVGCFFLLVVVVLSVYAVKQRKETRDNVIQTVRMTTSAYSIRATNDIESRKEPVRLAASIIGQTQRDEESEQVLKVLQQLCENTGAYMALYVDESGKGIDNQGRQVDIGTDIDLQTLSTAKVFCLEDDNVTGEPALVVQSAIAETSRDLLAYYKFSTLMKNMDIHDYDGSVWSSIVRADGTILYTHGIRRENLLAGHNLLDQMLDSLDANDQNSLKRAIKSMRECSYTVMIGTSKTVVSLVPLAINDWYFAMGLSDKYLSNMIANSWKATKTMVTLIVLSLIIFGTFVIVYFHVNRSSFQTKSVVLQNKADTDLLTELNNKMATERKIREYMEEFPGQQALMFVFDIDNFKKINDTRGHAFGDEVLREIGLRLRTEFRSSDIVGRAGGDEFILFLKKIPDDSILQKESLRVSNLFKDFKVGQYTKYSVTASIGCAVYPRDADNFEELYKAADQGLYKAKHRGKNQLAFYREEENQV